MVENNQASKPLTYWSTHTRQSQKGNFEVYLLFIPSKTASYINQPASLPERISDPRDQTPFKINTEGVVRLGDDKFAAQVNPPCPHNLPTYIL
jgi:hypothetical protein